MSPAGATERGRGQGRAGPGWEPWNPWEAGQDSIGAPAEARGKFAVGLGAASGSPGCGR